MKIQNSKFKIQNLERGASLYLALMATSLLLAIALGTNAILVNQLKTIKNIGDSVATFYAADTGIEEILMSQGDPQSACSEVSPCLLNNGAKYYLNILIPGPSCSADNFCVRSVGSFRATARAIEITY